METHCINDMDVSDGIHMNAVGSSDSIGYGADNADVADGIHMNAVGDSDSIDNMVVAVVGETDAVYNYLLYSYPFLLIYYIDI